MIRTALAISPHLDDAAFSAGATLAALARDGWRVIVATLFTGNVPRPTGFALDCQTSKGIGATVDYMALRRDEDRAACDALGAEPMHLPLLEAPHRGYDSAAALFAGILPNDDVLQEVEVALAHLLAEHRPDCLLAPRAIGAHVDHLHVSEAVWSSDAAPETWFWRDWPYVDRPNAPDPYAARFAYLPDTQGPNDAPFRDAKAHACAAYASQLGYQFGGPDALASRLASAGPERFAVRHRSEQ